MALDIVLKLDLTPTHETFIYLIIAFFSLTGIIYTLIMFLVMDVNQNIQNEKYQEKINNQDNIDQLIARRELYKNYGDEHLDHFSRIMKSINMTINELYLMTSMYMILLGLLLICISAYWFTIDNKTALISILTFMVGCITVGLNSFLCCKVTLSAHAQIIIRVHEDRIFAVKWLFQVSNWISTFSFSLIIFFLASFLYMARSSWNYDKENQVNRPLTADMYHQFAQAMLSFCLGVCFSSLFYRECLGQTGKAIIVGDELIGKFDQISEESENIYHNLQVSTIIANIFSQNLTQLLDSQSVLCALFGVSIIIASSIPEMQKHIDVSKDSDIDNPFQSIFMSFLVFQSFWTILGTGIAWIFGTDQDEQEMAPSIAFNFRLQMLIINPVVFIVFLFLPRYVFTRWVQIGVQGDIFFNYITHGDMIWCLCIGIIFQTILIVYGEYITSHAFEPIKKLAKIAKKDYFRGYLGFFQYSQNQIFYIMTFTAFILYLIYSIAGFYGLALGALAILSSQGTLLSISMFANIANGSYALAQLIKSYGSVIDILYKFAWVTRNFQVFSQIVNASSLMFINFSMFGAMLILGDIHDLQLWSGFTLFGFLIGGSFAYYLRGGSIKIAREVAGEIHSEYTYYRDKPKTEQMLLQRNIDQQNKLSQFVETKFSIGYKYSITYIIMSIAIILLIGELLGIESILGFIIGLNIIGIHMTMFQVLIGSQMQSAKYYNDNFIFDASHRKQQINNTELQLHLTSIESMPGTSLMSYLTFITLFALMGTLAFKDEGILRKFILQYVSFIPENSTKWIDSLQYGTEKLLTDGEHSLGQYQDYPQDGEKTYL